MKNSEQQHQVSEKSQVNETIDNTTSTLSEEQATTFNATFMVVGAYQTFQNDYLCTTSPVSEALSDVTSANVSNLWIEQNGKETLMERRPTKFCRKTVNMLQEMKVSFCNISTGAGRVQMILTEKIC